MDCTYTKCKLKSSTDQQFICCWLCDAHSHLSCAGFNGRQFDMLTDRSKGLRWSCPNCRSLDIDFYRMFRDAKHALTRMKLDFAAVTANFNKMESLFDKFEYINESPKRKKSAKDGARIKSNTLPGPSNLISLLSPGIEANPSCQAFSPTMDVVLPVEEPSPRQSEMPLSDAGKASTAGNNSSNFQQSNAGLVNPRLDGKNTPHCLVVVPPRKTIFLSRFASNTSIEDIGNFIISNHPNVGNEMAIFKFNYAQPREISSFKVSVPPSVFDVIVNKSFWPEGVLVREFIYRERVRPTVPAAATSLPTQITGLKN